VARSLSPSGPFRADHVGSLLRPRDLLAHRGEHATGEDDSRALRALEDERIEEVIRFQEDIGLESITDGEFRRTSWRLGFVDKVEGFVLTRSVGEVDLQQDDSGERRAIGAAPLAVGRIRRTGPIVVDEAEFVLARTKRTAKVTMPAPSYLHYPRGDACVDTKVYPDIEGFFSDVVEVYAEEVRALSRAGIRYLQLDEVAQPVLCDERIRDAVRRRGDDPDALIDRYIELINRIARHRTPEMVLAVHMCRGNAMGRWMASGGYDRIAEKTFNSLEVDAFFLEYDTPRAGGFEPLRYMPAAKSVVLGLVSTKTPELESREILKRRIEQASRFVPLDRLCLSPQCGFSSHSLGTSLSFEHQAAKLRLVVETAADVWGT
jgi:5-methyltetrahydropteroyltriglutamate--homocysteine methyltransferase